MEGDLLVLVINRYKWISSYIYLYTLDQRGCPDPVAVATFVFNEGAYIGFHDLHCDAQC